MESHRLDEVGQSFDQSLRAAQAYRDRMGPDQIKANLERDYVTREEFQATAERLQHLQAALDQLRLQKEVQDKKIPG